MTAVDDYLAVYGDYPPSRFDLDPYELGIWPDYCPVCDGTGIYRRATWIDPEEPCEACEGTGVADCTCPALCRYHEQEPSEAIDISGWRNPWDVWADYTEPPF